MGMKKQVDPSKECRNTPQVSSEIDSVQSGSFDILEIPQEFRGTFGELFQYLLTCYGTIAIGLFRCVLFKISYHLCLYDCSNRFIVVLDFQRINQVMLLFYLHLILLFYLMITQWYY